MEILFSYFRAYFNIYDDTTILIVQGKQNIFRRTEEKFDHDISQTPIKMSEVTGISRTSIQRILKHYKWHPYKIQLLHELNEDDHDRRLQFCEIMSQLMIYCLFY
nr:unnamed protein product [Callosobruchus chinensis]